MNVCLFFAFSGLYAKVICGFNVHNRNRQLDALAAGLQHDWNTFEDSAIISQRLLDVLWAE